MADLAQDAGVPYIEPRTKVEFPLLDVRFDLAKLGEGIRARRLDTVYKRMADKRNPAMPDLDYARVILDIDTQPIRIREILADCTTPDGAFRAIEMSLTKAGKKPDEAKEILKQFDPFEIESIAMIVTRGMKRPDPLPETEAEKKNPL